MSLSAACALRTEHGGWAHGPRVSGTGGRQHVFELPATEGAVRTVKLVFRDSTDPYGRVTLYTLDLIAADPDA